MYCPYCGSEILDSSNFCPDCGEAIKREKVIPEEKPIYSEKEKIYYDWLYNFFQENQGKPFTVKSLEQRLDPMNEKELGSLLQNILNKMRDRKIIGSALHDGENHYYFTDYKEPTQPTQMPFEATPYTPAKPKTNTAIVVVLVIIVGVILIYFGIWVIYDIKFFRFIFASPNIGITLLIIGAIMICCIGLTVYGSGKRRGRSSGGWGGCDGDCGDCDCDCGS